MNNTVSASLIRRMADEAAAAYRAARSRGERGQKFSNFARTAIRAHGFDPTDELVSAINSELGARGAQIANRNRTEKPRAPVPASVRASEPFREWLFPARVGMY